MGLLDIDMELMGGTIIFVLVALIMFAEVLGPLMYVDYTMSTATDEVKAVEFSNLARMRLISMAGDGRSSIDSVKVSSFRTTGEFGLGSNYVTLSSLANGQTWSFGRPQEGYKHDIYSTVTVPWIDIPLQKSVMLRKGNVYIIHIYKIQDGEKNIAFDIYPGTSCGDGAPAQQAFRPLSCSQAEGLVTVEAGASDLKSAVAVVSGTGLPKIFRINATADITPERLLIDDKKFEYCGSATRFTNYQCFRLIGKYAMPVRMHVEISPGKDIITVPRASGSETGAGGNGTGSGSIVEEHGLL
jgi:hypothetical protein